MLLAFLGRLKRAIDGTKLALVEEPRDAFATAVDRERHFRPQHVVPISLKDIASQLPGVRLSGDDTVQVTGVSLDSRSVLPGDLYAALPGAHVHGAQFIRAAQERGARAVYTDSAGYALAHDAGIAAIIADDARGQLGVVSAAVYDTAAHQPQLFGVTGTNGKTTTTFMVSSLLRALGVGMGTIGTIGITVGDDYVPSTMTTPEAPQLHGLMARMAESNVGAAVMEVSSHSMVFQRTAGLQFAVAGFTNLSPDHLDLHGTMDAYFEAKLALFQPELVSRAVVVIDDEWGERMAQEAGVDVVTLSTDGAHRGHWNVTDVRPEGFGHVFTLTHRDGRSLSAVVGLPGRFNVSNAALALTMVLEAGYDVAAVSAAVSSNDRPLSQGVPGRMEVVNTSPTVYVDFAHNPGGLMRMLETVQTSTGRVILVFGAAGERDAIKRASMGEIAARYADIAIVTDDDPHTEDAASIRAQVLEGAVAERREGREVLEIFPRADAIAAAIDLAAPEDIVVIAGRGHETVQDIAGALIDIDDREEVRKAVAQSTQR